MNRPPYYIKGNIVGIEDKKYRVESILREGKNIMQASKVCSLDRRGKPEDQFFVMKRFRTATQAKVAQRAFQCWGKVKEVLTEAGFPEMIHCDDEIILTRFAEGVDIKSLEAKGEVDIDGVCKIIRQSIQMISILMGENLAHGDVKPANIVGSQDLSKVALIDLDYMAPFGDISVPAGENQNERLSFGTPTFMAEEHMGGRYELTTDIYALAKSALFMLDRKYRINGKDLAQQYADGKGVEGWNNENFRRHVERTLLRHEPRKAREIGGLLDFSAAGMNSDWMKRPQNAEQVLQILRGKL